MLTAIEIENFKGIAARQRIDFAALTLLFGANSAGKSTILQSLLYLYELLERGSADVDRTELGGNVLELGGFARLVYRHELQRAIVLRAEFATAGGLERFGRDLTAFPFPDLDDDVESAWIELTIRFRTSPTHRGPLVERAVIGVNGEHEPLVWLEIGASLREGEPLQARVNLGHPLLAVEVPDVPVESDSEAGTADRPLMAPRVPAEVREAWQQIAMPEEVVDGTLDGVVGGKGFSDGRSLPVFAMSRSRLSAIPRIDEPIRVVPFGDIEGDREELARLSAQPATDETVQQARILSESIETCDRASDQVRTFLEMVVLGTIGQLSSFLRDGIYIGPLRTIPPRGFLYERTGRITSWADGLAAWDLLLADRLTLVERTNLWLRRLEAGCEIAVQQLFDRGADAEDLSDGHVDKTVRRLLLNTGAGPFVLPSEVGAGVSQIIPVVVAAVEGRAGVTLIEQPEIHVHPAVQVGLGDLFIDAVTRDSGKRAFVVETHSEHLILRVLRRIRETTENKREDEAPVFTAEALSVVHVEHNADGIRVRRLHVDAQGDFMDSWPKGFFDERFPEIYGE